MCWEVQGIYFLWMRAVVFTDRLFRIVTHFSSLAWSLWRVEWESYHGFLDPVLKSSCTIGCIWDGHACWLTAYKLLQSFSHGHVEAKSMSEKFRLFFPPLLLVFCVSSILYIFWTISVILSYLILHCVEKTSALSKVKSRFPVKLNCSLFLHKGYFNYINFTEELMRRI